MKLKVPSDESDTEEKYKLDHSGGKNYETRIPVSKEYNEQLSIATDDDAKFYNLRNGSNTNQKTDQLKLPTYRARNNREPEGKNLMIKIYFDGFLGDGLER
jgi:hypothetical protein